MVSGCFQRDRRGHRVSDVLVCSAAVEVQDEGMGGIQLFFTLLFSVLGLVVLVVVGLALYGRWKENKRKRFY